jgi:hypothetical protein
MTDYDRKMIELAATAAGYEIARWTDNGDALLLFGVQEPWSPLVDDGDALRLAVKLGISMEIDLHGDADTVAWIWPYFFDGMQEDHHKDPCAATRRAIVRAAAEIQKQKKEPQ